MYTIDDNIQHLYLFIMALRINLTEKMQLEAIFKYKLKIQHLDKTFIVFYFKNCIFYNHYINIY